MATSEKDQLPASLAARRMGLSRERVVRLFLQGQLDGSCVAGRYLISVRSVERMLAQHPPNRKSVPAA